MKDQVKTAVRTGYGATAKAGLGSHQAGIESIAKAFGYSAEELASIPAEANMGLSCGNPLATASLKEGETVVDLGSGGGLDVFLASKSVGPTGQAIGIDMTGEMIDLARTNASKGGYTNVRFLLGEIEAMPLPDNSADCIISNCVINLCPDKTAAMKEVFRVLKPGGRLAISDIVLRKPLPSEIESQVAAWTGCIAGAVPLDEFPDLLESAGFQSVHIQETGSDLNAYSEGGNAACCAPTTSDASACAPAEATPAAETEEAACCEPDPTGSACCAPPEPAKAEEPAAECCDPTTGCCEPEEPMQDIDAQAQHDSMSAILAQFNVNDYAASVRIFAVKP